MSGANGGRQYRLRHGSSYDPRLDRLRQVDLRSLNYPVSELLWQHGSKIRPYTWPLPTALMLDQGTDGACVGAAFAHDLAAMPKVVRGVTMPWAVHRIYWEAQKLDPWQGGSYPGAEGNPYEGTSVLAGAQATKALGWITEYRWAFTLRDFASAIGHIGPGVIGVDWYQGMHETDADGFIRPTGTVLGGHCVLVNGVSVVKTKGGDVDPVRSYFTITNSWGVGWGLDGRCRLSFVDAAVLWPGGDWVIPIARKAGEVS